MTLAYIDRVDTLNLVEKNGAIRSLTRKCRVIFTIEDIPADFSILSAALDLCPQPYETLSLAGADYSSLVLVERSAELVEQDNSVVDVTLKYEHILDGPNQQLIAGATGYLYGKGRCSITDKVTNFFYPNGDLTKPKTLITVGHTYSNFDPEVLAQCVLGPTLPWTILQGGEVNIPFPQANYKLHGVITIDVATSPQGIAKQFIACINEDTWLGDPPMTWICSEVQWEVLNVSSGLYRFEFEFQYNSDTWNPTVVFLDQRTGRPPDKVLKATVSDSNGILRLVPNPLRAAAVPPDSPAQAGATAAAGAAAGLIGTAYQAAFDSLFDAAPAAPPIMANAASAAALAAAQAYGTLVTNSSFLPYGGQSPVVLNLPGALAGNNAGSQVGFAAANVQLPQKIAQLNATFVVNASLPIGGGQALSDIGVQIGFLAGTAGADAGADAGAAAAAALAANGNINQAAGLWQVPALKTANFHTLFVTLLEA